MRSLLLASTLLLLVPLVPSASAVGIPCASDPGAFPDNVVDIALWVPRIADNVACRAVDGACKFAWDVVFGNPACLVWFYEDDTWPL